MSQYDIYEFLKKNQPKDFSSNELSQELGYASSRTTARKAMILIRWGLISKREVKKDGHKQKPYYYYEEHG